MLSRGGGEKEVFAWFQLAVAGQRKQLDTVIDWGALIMGEGYLSNNNSRRVQTHLNRLQSLLFENSWQMMWKTGSVKFCHPKRWAMFYPNLSPSKMVKVKGCAPKVRWNIDSCDVWDVFLKTPFVRFTSCPSKSSWSGHPIIPTSVFLWEIHFINPKGSQ